MTGDSPPVGSLSGDAARRQTAHEFVRETIRRGILSGQLAAGTRLVQSDLAEQLNVSTTPVREALRDLASDGLVDFDPHRGGIVHQLDADELEEVCELRAVLEPVGVRRAADALTDDDLDRLGRLAEDMEATDDLASWLDGNRRFHLIIHEATGSDRLRGILESLQDATTMYVAQAARSQPDVIRTSNEDHRALIDALAAGRVEQATTIIARHVTTPARSLDPEELGGT